MKKYLKLTLKILVSLVFVFWIVFKVNWTQTLVSVQRINIFFIILYVIVVVFGIFISSYKWKVLANYQGIKMKLFDFFKFYLTGTFINNFMPSFIGGDTYKAYSVGKKQKKYLEAVSSVVMDRITGLFGAIILALFFSILNFGNIINHQILLLINLIVLASFFTGIFIKNIRKLSFWSFLKKYFPEKIVNFMDNLSTYGDPKIIQKSILLAFIFNFFGVALANYILFMALGIKIGALNYLSVIFLISIIASVPISINNIGIKEWAYITLFGIFGVSASAVVVVAILSRIVQMLISFFALPVYLRHKN